MISVKYSNFLIFFWRRVSGTNYEIGKEWIKACCLITCCLINLKAISNSSCNGKCISDKVIPQAKWWCDGIEFCKCLLHYLQTLTTHLEETGIWGTSISAWRKQKNLKLAAWLRGSWNTINSLPSTPRTHLHLNKFFKNLKQILLLFCYSSIAKRWLYSSIILIYQYSCDKHL